MKKILYILIFAALSTEAQAVIGITRVEFPTTQHCLGEVEVTATGNAGPFKISWGTAAQQTVNNVNGSYTIGHLCPDSDYHITVTNQFGCSVVLDTHIGHCNPESSLTVGLNMLTHSTFPGDAEGEIDIFTTTTENSILYFKWTNQEGEVISINEDLKNVDAGTYCVEVTSGCGVVEKCFTVKDCTCACPIGIEFDLSFQCKPWVQTGSLKALVDSEFPPFTFNWSGPGAFTSNMPIITSIGVGEYCVTVTDKCGRTNTSCQQIKCCDSYELPDAKSDYECFYWEGPLGGNHPHDGLLEVRLPERVYGDPECNSKFKLQWSSDGSENHVTFNPTTQNWDGVYFKNIITPGIHCVTVTNSCGCSRKSCKAFGDMGQYSGFDYVRLDAFLYQNLPGYNLGGAFYDFEYPVLTNCYQCSACGMKGERNVVRGECNDNYQEDLFTIDDPEPYDEEPCTGGTINCHNNPPNPFSPWTILNEIKGIEIVDRNAVPTTISIDGALKCVYPAWCIFPPGTIDNFPVNMPVLVKHPVGKVVPVTENTPCNIPPSSDCPNRGILMNDGVDEDCILRWYCSTTGEVIEIDDSFLDQIVICECTVYSNGQGSSFCATVKRCKASSKGEPTLCGGYEILFNNCEQNYPNCQVAITTPPDESTDRFIDKNNEDQNNLLGIRVYPNPSTGDIRVDFDHKTNISEQKINIEITDLSGRKVCELEKTIGRNTSSVEMSLDEYNVTPGAYTLTIKNEKERIAKFLILKTK